MDEQDWWKLEELFHAAWELAPDARPAFLDDACRGNTELRRQIDALLANGALAGSFLEAPAAVQVTAPSIAARSLLGREFGVFCITSHLGAGGMGEVYRAHDRELDRDVAIKMLPPEFADDPDRLARFRREARTLASLNHPNIAAIYGVEPFDEVNGLVLELVDGDTLAQQIQQRGALPLADALDIGRQMAEALEAAHEKGVIHRDLKPANVKVTDQGRVKVLDFGLAKAVASVEASHPLSNIATVTGVQTLAGHVVGTPGYMSPEQARGEDVDQRTDIWAFGCLLYELLAGRRAFRGDSLSETIAAVLERDPDWQALPGRTPTKIRSLLRTCLHKDPSRRLAHMADARLAIEDVLRGSNRWRLAAVGVAALALLAIAGMFWARVPPTMSDPSKWERLTKFSDSVTQPALSPDGRMVAFIRGPSTFVGAGQVYVKMLPDGEPVQLTNDTVVKMHPVFSPDGTRIAYSTYLDQEFSWDTWTVPVLGGEPQKWLKNASGLTWTGPGQLLFSEIKKGLHMGIVAADENRMGERDVYLPATEPGMAHRSYLSPDAKSVLLVEMDEDHLWETCRVVPADGSSPGRSVGPPGGGCTSGAWSPDGKWIYLTSNAVGANHIWRQRFPDGRPEQMTSGPTEEEGIAMMQDGRSFVTAVAVQNTSIWIHDRRGERQISLEGNAAEPTFTPDGKKLLFRVVREPPSEFAYYRDFGEVRIADIDSGRSEPLARGVQALDYDVSADGRQVVMQVADHDGKSQLWLAPLDRSSPPRQIPGVEGGWPRFVPGTDEILFRRVEGNAAVASTGFVYRVRPDGTNVRRVLDQPALMMGPVSPDGKWLVTWAPLQGNGPPAFQAFPVAGGGPPIVIGSATQVAWSPDARSLAIWSAFGAPIPEGRTYLVPLPAGTDLPVVPQGGFQSENQVAHLAGAHKIDETLVVPGSSADVYAFYRGAAQRNLYRIPIP